MPDLGQLTTDGPVAVFTHHPEEDLGMVVIKDHWSADNGVETATFSTLQAAQEFARVRWGWQS